MGATSAPTLIGGGSAEGPIKAHGSVREKRVLVSFAFSASYATGGDTLTLPTADVRGMDLKGMNLLTTFFAGVDRIYSWNGSVSAPKIVATVISTGAQVANATDISGDGTLRAELFYGS